MNFLTNILYNAAVGLMIGVVSALFLWGCITAWTLIWAWTGNMLLSMLITFGAAGGVAGAVLAIITYAPPLSRG